jgi:glycosyltransferase involved in cell wall biosynthesis
MIKEMGKKKVLHIVEDLKIGGLERVIASITLGLDRTRYKVEVWCLVRGGGIAEELTSKGVGVRVLHMDSYYNPWKVIILSRIIRESGIQIVHTHGYFASTFGRLAGVIARVPIIISHVHSSYSGYKRRNILMERFLSYYTDKIVCVSRSVQRFVVDAEKIAEGKTRVIYNGCSLSGAGKVTVGAEGDGVLRDIGKQDLVMIVVASLTPNKGHNVLLNALKIVSQRIPRAKLLIAGDGPLRVQLKESAYKLGIGDKVIFAGQRKDVAKLLQVADVFILPSVQREGLGVALIEAMAEGLPVIGSRLGGIPEVIEDNVNGFLVPPGDSNELARRMMTLLEDQSMRDKMGKMGRKIYEKRFMAAKMIHNVESLYDELMMKR